MSSETKIRWTNCTWNPTRGCSIVSPGCSQCYAMSVAARFSGPGLPYEGLAERVNGHPVWTGEIMLVEKNLELPLHWKKPRRIFVDSMSDLFHEKVPFEYIDRVFDVMARCPQHIFQILTKRPERMREYMERGLRSFWGPIERRQLGLTWPPENVWLGTSVEDQRRADERIAFLVATQAAVRFLSCEPLLSPVDLEPWIGPCCEHRADCHCGYRSAIHWVIVGGESGPGYRPMELEWARSIRDQCVKAGVAYFFKQSSGIRTEMGQELDGKRWEQFPVGPRLEAL